MPDHVEQPCPTCDGRGVDFDSFPCRTCGGSGRIRKSGTGSVPSTSAEQECPTCGGDSFLADSRYPCPDCRRSGSAEQLAGPPDFLHYLEAWLSGYNADRNLTGEELLAEARKCFDESGAERAKRVAAALQTEQAES